MRVIKDVQYNEIEACKLDMYLPDESGFETIVWFHGGGLVSGDKLDGERLAPSIVAAGYAFVSVEYRMYTGGAKFPDFINDVAEAVAFVKANIHSHGGDGARLYISGQSAGAWMALMLCFNETYLKNVGVNPAEILGWIIDSAQTTAHFNVLKYELGEDARAQRINEFAPQYFIGERSAFSRMLLIFYERDMACRYEQNMLFYKSVLAFNGKADISYVQLPGVHCHGSCTPDEDGGFAYVKTTLQWLEQAKN